VSETTRTRALAIALVLLGVAQMAGDLSGLTPLKGLATATNASPAPKVFSAVRGLETYSTRFFIEWQDGTSIELTPEVYGGLEGPYNRRNVYGAALAYAPVLPAELREPVMKYALCGEAGMIREVGLSPGHGKVAVRLEPVEGTTLPPDMETRIEAPCR